MTERIIVTLTTWSARVGNIPAVLDTIFAQTLLPDKVVLNVAYELEIPTNVQEYINYHDIEVYRCLDTKVYKKLLHTLDRYRNDCVINIDDDLLYQPEMIEDFINVHKVFPNNPICGNHMYCCGLMCHCGEASLTKYEYFGDYLNQIDEIMISSCPSSDMVFSYLATLSGHPYVPAKGFYGTEYTPAYNAIYSWTDSRIQNKGIQNTFNYLEKRFGKLPELFSRYIKDVELSKILTEIGGFIEQEARRKQEIESEKKVRQTKSYKLGYKMLHPVKSFIKYIKKNKSIMSCTTHLCRKSRNHVVS